MTAVATAARLAFASGLIGIGLQQAMLADFSPLFAPVGPELIARPTWAMLSGVLLVVASAAVLANLRQRIAALILACMLLADCGLLVLPRLILAPSSGQAWVVAFELIALAGTAFIVAATAAAEPRLPPSWNALIDRLRAPGLACFGISSIVFGVVHFPYARAIASLIPPWIPGALAWAYLLGIARIAAGLSVVTRVQARLAATLMAAMYSLWIVLVHLPQTVQPRSQAADWTFLLLAMTLFGGSLLTMAFAEVAPRVGRTAWRCCRRCRASVPQSGMQPRRSPRLRHR